MRRIVALLLLALLAGRVQAQGDAPFLWEVEGPKATHYLLGSVHLLPESVYPLPPAIERAWTKTAALVLETDADALAAPETQQQMLAQGLAPAGLAKLIAPELHARVRRHAAGLGLPEGLCDSFKPWFCALALGVLEFQRAGMDPQFGLDFHFHRRARTDGRTVTWLESPESQLALFSDLDNALSERMLLSTLNDLHNPKLQPAELVRLWRENRAAELADVLDDSFAEFPELRKRLLADRNRAWVAPLRAKFDGADAQLVVVGAAHLVGADNVVELLRAQGYTVRAVAE